MSSARQIVIDRRPLWVLLLERSRRPAAFIALGLAFWAAMSLTPPEGLTLGGLRALCVFGLCVILWMTGLLPLAVTSLLAIVLVPLAGVLAPTEAYSLFGNQAIFFVLGAFILAAAMMKTGLSARLALGLLRRAGSSPKRLVAGVTGVTALMCVAMPSHAAAALMFPIVVEVVRSLDLRPGRSRYARSLFLGLAWGSCVGSNVTLLSSARAALSLGMLEQNHLPLVPFSDWTLIALPMALLQGVLVLGVLLFAFRSELDTVEPAVSSLERRINKMGKVRMDERLAGLVLLATIVAWVALGAQIGLASIAIVAAVALYVLRVVTWKDAEEYVNWGIFLLYGGAIALGAALDRSGAARWVTENTLAAWLDSPMSLLTALSGVAVLLSEGISNSAVVATMAPLGMAIAPDFGLDPRLPVMAIAMPAGLAFILPTSTPALALAFSSGHLRVRDTLLPGLALDVGCWLIFLVSVWLWWPLVGYGVGA